MLATTTGEARWRGGGGMRATVQGNTPKTPTYLWLTVLPQYPPIPTVEKPVCFSSTVYYWVQHVPRPWVCSSG